MKVRCGTRHRLPSVLGDGGVVVAEAEPGVAQHMVEASRWIEPLNLSP